MRAYVMISVIIPIFNVETFLEQCLDSVIAQDFDDFEVIGVDDCSTDGSVEVFKKYLKDKRFQLIRHYENLGLPSARNSGLFRANGEFVCFLDSDDWIAPHMFSELYSLINYSGAHIAIGGVVKYEELTGKVIAPENHRRVMRNPFLFKTIFERPELFYSVTSWGKLISMRFLKETGLFFKATPRRFEDMLTYKWYLSGAKVSTSSQVMYFYRQRAPGNSGPSIMQSKELSVFADKFLAYGDIFRFTLNSGFFGTDYDPLNSKFAMFNLPRALNRLLKELFAENSTKNLTNSQKDEFLSVITSLKELFCLFPEDYVAGLSKEAQECHSLVVSESIPVAFRNLINLKY